MRVEVPKLKTVATQILCALGENQTGAELVADCLVKADMRGITTHGIYLLKVIAERVKGNMLTLPTIPTLIMDDQASALVNGQDGLGQIAADFAMEFCVKKAKHFGISLVLVRNTNNVGFLGYYTEKATNQGMIGIMASNAAPSMAPWGGAEPFVGTNPISIAIPAGEGETFLADMASSVVARGKIRKAARQKQAIPKDWALDQDGIPTTNPDGALRGTLLPMGGPKGSALALAVDIIAGLLAGSSFGPAINTFHALQGPTGVGVLCIAIDIRRFSSLIEFNKSMLSYVGSVKGMRKAAGFDEILIPGEIERRKEQESLTLGIELDDLTISALDELLSESGSNMRLGG